MDINYNNYRVFYYVAKHRNVTLAAQTLMSSQSNVTRAIKSLENTLGCTLFIRSNRGVSLTAEGERLYAHVQAAMEHLLAGEEELSLESQTLRGTVSIGTSGVALRCFLLRVLEEFQHNHPQVRLRISNHSTPQAIAALKSGAVDLALVTSPVDVTPAIKVSEVKTIRNVAVGGAAYETLGERTLALSELCNYPLVSLGPHTKTHELYTAWFAIHGLRFSPDIEAYTSDQILPIVRNNLGIGFVPQEIFEAEKHDSLVRLKLEDEPPSRSICFIKRTDQTLSLAAKELERLILRAAE